MGNLTNLEPGDIVEIESTAGFPAGIICSNPKQDEYCRTIYTIELITSMKDGKIGRLRLTGFRVSNISDVIVRTSDLCKGCLTSMICNKVNHSLDCYRKVRNEHNKI